MNEYIEKLIHDNPEKSLICQNPECGESIMVSTRDFFSDDKFILKCPHCGKESSYPSGELAEALTQKMKELQEFLNSHNGH